jgi:hypothetical protein
MAKTETKRVKWHETRSGADSYEQFTVVAEMDSEKRWKFSERSTWEVRWYEIQATAEMAVRARRLLAQSNRKPRSTSVLCSRGFLGRTFQMMRQRRLMRL